MWYVREIVKRPTIFQNVTFSSHFPGWTEINYRRISEYSVICVHFSAHAHVYSFAWLLYLYSSPYVFLFFFFAFTHLSRFVLSFLFLSFPPFCLSIYHPLPLLFSLSFTVKQYGYITRNNPSQKKKTVLT